MGEGSSSVLAAVGRSDGVVRKTLSLYGAWGIPRIGTDAVNGSISRDGRTLVLAGTGIQSPTDFAIVDTKTLELRDTVRLQGQYAFDALSPNGRRMYLIQYAAQDNSRLNPGGYPFVHALDTVRGVAHCTGIPWTGSNTEPWKMRLALRDGGHRLAVTWVTGGTYVSLNTRTWKLSGYAPPAGFPWLWVGIGTTAVAALGLLLLRRRRRPGRLQVAVG